MQDLISRQAAIDALAKAMPSLTTPDGSGAFDHDIQIADEAFVDAMQIIQELPSAQPEQRWIPCSERLPERGKDVLVTRDYDGREDCNKSCRYVEIASCYGEDDDPDWTSFSDEYKMHPKNHHVIAWRELPEPYSGRGKHG